MKAVLRDYHVLWRMALSARHGYARAFLLSITALASLSVGALVYLKTSDAGTAIGLAVRIVAGGLMSGYVMYFLAGAARLNTPLHARLVPRMRRRLIQLTAASWGAATGAAGLLAWGTPVSPAFILLGMGTWLASLGLARSGHRAGMVLQFMFFPVFALPGLGAFARQHLAQGPGFAMAAVLLLALGVFALKTMFMDGGDRHYALRTAQKFQAERLTREGQFKARDPNPLAMRIYLAALRRNSAGHDGRKLLAHLFGAREHWTQQVLMLGGAALLSGVAVFALRQFGGETLRDMLAELAPTFASALFIASLFASERSNIRLMQTRGEQALLRLAPVMPTRAPLFNRRLARLLLTNAALGWCVLLAAALLVTLASGAPASALFRQACLACLMLPLIGTNLRRHAVDAGPLGLGPILCLFASCAASFGASALMARVFGTPLLMGAALTSVLIAAIVVPWRWKRSVEAPIAFPVGRLA